MTGQRKRMRRRRGKTLQPQAFRPRRPEVGRSPPRRRSSSTSPEGTPTSPSPRGSTPSSRSRRPRWPPRSISSGSASTPTSRNLPETLPETTRAPRHHPPGTDASWSDAWSSPRPATSPPPPRRRRCNSSNALPRASPTRRTRRRFTKSRLTSRPRWTARRVRCRLRYAARWPRGSPPRRR